MYQGDVRSNVPADTPSEYLVLALLVSFDSNVDDCVSRFKPLGDLYERNLPSPECV